MKTNTWIILLTMAVSLLIWGFWIALVIVISPQLTSSIDPGRVSNVVLFSSLAITLVSASIVGIIMSRMAAQRQKKRPGGK